MSNHGEVYDKMESILAKLYVLKDSCAGKTLRLKRFLRRRNP